MTLDRSKSKTGAIKSLLIRAWRERWSDVQWGIQIKTILPRGCSGDAYNLSEILLDQACLGPAPNVLVLGFLRHSLASQVVSHASVLAAVAQFRDWPKPHCTAALLALLESARTHITCKGRPEDCVQLAWSLLGAVQWLLRLLEATFQGWERWRSAQVESRNYHRALQLLQFFAQSPFSLALLHLGRGEDPAGQAQLLAVSQRLSEQLRQVHLFDPEPAALRQELTQVLAQLRTWDLAPPSLGPSIPLSHVGSIQPRLALEVLLHPTTDLVRLSRQLYALAWGRSLTFSAMVFQILQSCLLSFSARHHFDALRWDAFLFWKLPLLIERLSVLMQVDTSQLKAPTELYKAFERLLASPRLLNAADVGGECNVVQVLLSVLGQITPRLMTETEVDDVLNGRAAQRTPRPPDADTAELAEFLGGASRKIELTLKAESTMNSILKTLDTEYTKPESMEDLLGVLAHIIQGESADLLLAASVAIGQSPAFVRSMVKFNQQAQESQGESVKNSLLRAGLFDMTFLMLVYTAQRSGCQLVRNEVQGTFMDGWIRDMFIEDGHVKPMHQETTAENTMVDNLLQQLHSGDLRTQVVKWQNVCGNIHLVMKEMVYASSSEMLDPATFGKMCQTMCSKLCSIPICVMTWLLSYKSCVANSTLKMNRYIKEMLSLLANEDTFAADMPHKTERVGLMKTILNRMLQDVGMDAPFPTNPESRSPNHKAKDAQPLSAALKEEWDEIAALGRVNSGNVHKLVELYKAGGAVWFTSVLIEDIFSIVYEDQLDKRANLLVALFHIDLEQCTSALLLRVIPSYLTCRTKKYRLTDPHGNALAKVLVGCIYAVLIPEHCNAPKSPVGSSKKRTVAETEWENDLTSIKIRKVLSNIMDESAMGYNHSTIASQSALSRSETGSEESAVSQATGFFLKVLHAICQECTLTPAVHFAVRFLEQAAGQGKTMSWLIFHHLNTQMVLTLIKIVPDLFNIRFVAQLFDNTSSQGRKNMARTICLLRNILRKRELAKSET
eukprot:maker-scaffold846_size89341-snap-gene-0.14 protein:Tk05678 transcript:maker-scaffold846_size89341-snap-gene-0.14-mRNA-1 annotation:"mediator of rna polymerase ii transcription subunit 24-like"